MKAPLSFWLRVPGTLWRTYRFRGLARRGRHEFRKRFGRFRPQPVFSPPRPDFVEKPGWVCNEADYPLSEEAMA